MRRRFLLAMILILMAILACAPGRAVAAAGAYPRTDFTRVTPASAIVYATLQSTSARQASALSQMVTGIGAQPALQGLLGAILGAAGGTSAGGGAGGIGSTGGMTNTAVQQVLPTLTGTLGRIFNGELALAALPPTITASKGSLAPRIHLLIDAGLQPGVSAGALLFGVAAFGLPTGSAPSYRGFTITALDLNQLARAIGKLANNAQLAKGTLIPANGPISSTVYGAVAGGVAVLATDLPTLEAALDTYSGAAPSIAAGDAFAGTVGLLPSERFATIYVHLDASVIDQIVRSLLGGAGASLPAPQVSATPGRALSLTAEAHALLLTLSAPPGTSSVVLPLP